VRLIGHRQVLFNSYSAQRNSVGVTQTTRRKTCAKWLGLVYVATNRGVLAT
jgi:hypothetical protein